MPANTKIQLRRGLAAEWTSTNPVLAAGEIGFETNTGKFKIGTDGITAWVDLPYAGGSAINAGSGICSVYNSGTNSYTLSSQMLTSGSGINLSETACGTSGSSYTIALNNRLQEVSKLTSSGLMVSTSSSGVTTRSISQGSNIVVTNGNGIAGDPSIALDTTLTGLNTISASGMTLTGSGQALTVNNDVYIGGTLSAVQINLNGITASGNVGISGDLTVSGSGTFGSGVYVNGVPVSLSGHQHVYTDITNFCSGVASCVDTALVGTTGVQSVYSSGTNTLSLGLSGQALAIHNFNSNGMIVRTGDAGFAARTITSGTNISITNGDGVSGNPTISLADAISVGSVSTTGNLIVGNNLIVNGSTITASVDTMTVEDPVIVLGQTSGTIANTSFDRGLELRIGVAQTGFMGYDVSANEFVLLSSTTNSSETFVAGTYGGLSLGYVTASGLIKGRTLESTVTGPTAPIVVASTGLVTNLNSDLLDGNHGSHYLDWGNFSNIPDPTVTVTLSGDIAGTGSYTWTNLSGNLSIGINSTIQPSSVALGTDTTGNYAGAVGVSGNGLTINTPAGAGGTYTVSSNAVSTNTVSTLVFRDSSGNFNANMIGVGTVSGVNTITYSGNTVASYGSTSISGIAANNYLFNFIIDGGTP